MRFLPPDADTRRMRPVSRLDTSALPFGRNAMPQGTLMPRASRRCTFADAAAAFGAARAVAVGDDVAPGDVADARCDTEVALVAPAPVLAAPLAPPHPASSTPTVVAAAAARTSRGEEDVITPRSPKQALRVKRRWSRRLGRAGRSQLLKPDPDVVDNHRDRISLRDRGRGSDTHAVVSERHATQHERPIRRKRFRAAECVTIALLHERRHTSAGQLVEA